MVQAAYCVSQNETEIENVNKGENKRQPLSFKKNGAMLTYVHI